jgi:hypothetical protein
LVPPHSLQALAAVARVASVRGPIIPVPDIRKPLRLAMMADADPLRRGNREPTEPPGLTKAGKPMEWLPLAFGAMRS